VFSRLKRSARWPFFIFCVAGSTEWDGKKNISPLTGSPHILAPGKRGSPVGNSRFVGKPSITFFDNSVANI